MDPWWGAKLSHASRPKNQNIKQKRYCNKFKKRLKKQKKMAWVVLTGNKHPSPKVYKQGLEGQLASQQGYCEETAEACPSKPEPLRSAGPGGPENSTREFSLVMTSFPRSLLQKLLGETQSIYNQNTVPNSEVPGENEGLNYRLWPREETVQ